MIDDHLLFPIDDISSLRIWTVVRRKNDDKDQQGAFIRIDDNKNLILANAIDLLNDSFYATEGILKPEKGTLFCYRYDFKTSSCAREALSIVHSWPLYKINKSISQSIIKFVTSCYSPEQIIELKNTDRLKALFVPIKQKFRLGEYAERRSPERIICESFKEWLDSMHCGDHITYIAQIMQQRGYVPKFFSTGTSPHQITESYLINHDYSFKPTHGGHIKSIGPKEKKFLVDAGSNHFGRGVKSNIKTAEMVASALKRLYPDYYFIAVEGRGAFGSEQSF